MLANCRRIENLLLRDWKTRSWWQVHQNKSWCCQIDFVCQIYMSKFKSLFFVSALDFDLDNQLRFRVSNDNRALKYTNHCLQQCCIVCRWFLLFFDDSKKYEPKSSWCLSYFIHEILQQHEFTKSQNETINDVKILFLEQCIFDENDLSIVNDELFDYIFDYFTKSF